MRLWQFRNGLRRTCLPKLYPPELAAAWLLCKTHLVSSLLHRTPPRSKYWNSSSLILLLTLQFQFVFLLSPDWWPLSYPPHTHTLFFLNFLFLVTFWAWIRSEMCIDLKTSTPECICDSFLQRQSSRDVVKVVCQLSFPLENNVSVPWPFCGLHTAWPVFPENMAPVRTWIVYSGFWFFFP